MKFPHNTSFNSRFDKIDGLEWYPYVGEKYDQSTQKLMVYAHNIPSKPEELAARTTEFSPKNTWSDAVEEYAYWPLRHTKTFRSFVQGLAGLDSPYYYDSPSEVTTKVDVLLARISYINFIQGLVPGESQMTTAEPEHVDRSKQINRRILEILNTSHCICWGKHVFNHVTTLDGWTVLERQNLELSGFGYGLIQHKDGRKIHVLKVFHPAMPGFYATSHKTHKIFSDFLALPNA